MTAMPRRITVRYDGKCLIPREPLDLPQDEDIDVVVSLPPRTLAEVRLGIPPIILKGQGPTATDIVLEERGTA
jgi:hypothetical protein